MYQLGKIKFKNIWDGDSNLLTPKHLRMYLFCENCINEKNIFVNYARTLIKLCDKVDQQNVRIKHIYMKGSWAHVYPRV